MGVRESAVTSIDPKWVKGIRAWVKKTFVSKASYKSTQDILDHLRQLRDKDLNRLWEYLFYTKGLLPRLVGDGESIIDKFKGKLAVELKAAKAVLDEAMDPLAFSIAAMTPGTLEYRSRPDIREFYERINPTDPETAMRLGFEDRAKEYIPKVEAILSGKLLRAVSAFLERYADDTPFEQDEILLEYTIGDVKLVYDGVPDPRTINRPESRSPRGLDKYIPYFQDAKALLDRRGFGKVWYGPVFVGCPSCGGENPHGKHFGVGAHYVHSNDQIVVFLDPKPFLVELLIHELGHRYYYKFMDRGDRARFDSYFKEVAAVSSYGSSDPAEDFAEVFAHFVMGKDMTRDQIERFKAFLAKKDRGRFAAEQVARRYASGVDSKIVGGSLYVTLPAEAGVLRDVLSALKILGMSGLKATVTSRNQFDSKDGPVFAVELPFLGVTRGDNYLVVVVDGNKDLVRPLSPTITLKVTP